MHVSRDVQFARELERSGRVVRRRVGEGLFRRRANGACGPDLGNRLRDWNGTVLHRQRPRARRVVLARCRDDDRSRRLACVHLEVPFANRGSGGSCRSYGRRVQPRGDVLKCNYDGRGDGNYRVRQQDDQFWRIQEARRVLLPVQDAGRRQGVWRRGGRQFQPRPGSVDNQALRGELDECERPRAAFFAHGGTVLDCRRMASLARRERDRLRLLQGPGVRRSPALLHP